MTFIDCPACDEPHAILIESDGSYIAPAPYVSEVGSCARTEGGWVCDCGTTIPDAEIESTAEAAAEGAALAAAGV